jgi:hypothetical protein
MTAPVAFVDARTAFHATLLKSTLTINGAGVVSNADGSSAMSRNIAKGCRAAEGRDGGGADRRSDLREPV